MSTLTVHNKELEAKVANLESEFLRALLARDIQALEVLLSPAMIFTSPWGDMVGKKDFLEIAASDEISLEKAEAAEIEIFLHGPAAVAVTYLDMGGVFFGEEVDAEFQSVRAWVPDAEGRWQILTSQCFEEEPFDDDFQTDEE